MSNISLYLHLWSNLVKKHLEIVVKVEGHLVVDNQQVDYVRQHQYRIEIFFPIHMHRVQQQHSNKLMEMNMHLDHYHPEE